MELDTFGKNKATES